MFDEIRLLVLEGDAAGLAAKVSDSHAVREPEQGQARPSRPPWPPAVAPRTGPGPPRLPPGGAHGA